MSFGQAVRSGFRNWNKIGGRASKSEYLWWWTFFALVGFAAVFGIPLIESAVYSSTVLSGPAALAYVLVLTVPLILYVPTFTLTIRRLHDTNRSGRWLFPILFPVRDGSPGPNRFGPRPGGNLPMYQLGVADELRKLEELRVAGTISDAEFDRQRSRLLPD